MVCLLVPSETSASQLIPLRVSTCRALWNASAAISPLWKSRNLQRRVASPASPSWCSLIAACGGRNWLLCVSAAWTSCVGAFVSPRRWSRSMAGASSGHAEVSRVAFGTSSAVLGRRIVHALAADRLTRSCSRPRPVGRFGTVTRAAIGSTPPRSKPKRRGLTPHELRHTAASLAVSAGANVKAVQRMLGHASAAMTLDRYADLFDDDLDAVAERLDALGRAAGVAYSWPERQRY